jgi:signal transduction histidine kinase/DNA-binding response OmpR family regulator
VVVPLNDPIPSGPRAEEPADRVDILVVDDLDEKLLVFETVLGELDQNLVLARSGAEALRQVLRRDFAVILLDVNMPDMDGFETAALIRKYKRSAHTPIIFITSYADEMQTARGYSLGAVDYIPSPVVPEVLRSKVRVFVELHILQRRIGRQAEERIALAASETALRAAEEATRRSQLLGSLSHALAGPIDPRDGARTLLAHVVPALAATATVALFDEQGEAEHVEHRFHLGEDVPMSLELAPRALPEAHRALLAVHDARLRDGTEDGPIAEGALRLLPLVHGQRRVGALWVDGELTELGESSIEDLAARAAIAFAAARLYRNLQLEIGVRRQAEARLEEANRRKDEFLAMLSHELRNPLAPIRNAVEVIRLIAPPDAKLRWAADVTDRQVRQLTRLVDELLDVARISQGKITLQRSSLDLVTLVSQCVETQRPAVATRRLSLSMTLPSRPVRVRGDATRLAQVVNNLLTNATKYTHEGGAIAVTIERAAGEGGRGDECAIVSVTDDGIGIEPDLLPRVFDLFEQGKRALDRTQGGLGVGLTLVQRLVDLHGGQVRALSEGEGRGATFQVMLPCLADEESGDVVETPGERLAVAAVGRRILVVDDNVDAAETTTLLLSISGHDVRSASDGVSALETAEAFSPEVVLLDIGLPLMDGYEVARRLRQLPQTRQATLIALTGYGQQADRLRGREAGFDGHLLKPVDPLALARLVERGIEAAPALPGAGSLGRAANVG